MNRKEKVYAYIKSEDYIPLKANELAVVLDVPKTDMDEFMSVISELIIEGKVYVSKRNKIVPVDNNQIVSGTLMCNASKGFGFVRCDDDAENDIFISADKLNMAYDSDRVLVGIDKYGTDSSRREGHIIQVIERGNDTAVGVITGINSKGFVIRPDRAEFFTNIYVPEHKINNARKNDRVLVKIEEYNKKGVPLGAVISNLGPADSILSCLDGLIAQKSLSRDFSEFVLDEIKDIPDTVTAMELVGREDYRKKTIFTIDGDDSRDFDDAISLEFSGNNRILGVHIADVTHYVAKDSAIDKEALKRATSVYFPHTVIPMLPKKLSNGICSLNPDVDRLAISVLIELDENANVLSYKVNKSVIHSCARMTYNNVNKILDGDKVLCTEYKPFIEILNEMNKLSKQLIKKREDRGAIDFDFPESRIICDNEANPIEIKIDQRGNSQRLIESFMLLANETIAEMAFWSELPFIYRVHETPTNEKLTEFNEFIKNFGYSLKGKIDSETIHPKALQELNEKVKGSPEEMMISKMMLRSLMKACYRNTNDGHFGLAAKYYCHFTSPIRRYPDLFIHRVLTDYLNGTLNDKKYEEYDKISENVSVISSEQEVNAELSEREAADMLKAAFMSKYIGESFDAVVSSVTSFGIFAMLDNGCEGLIKYETMNDDYFDYDDKHKIAIGKRTGKTYSIGNSIRICVAAADVLTKRIDFVFEKDGILAFKPVKQRKIRGKRK